MTTPNILRTVTGSLRLDSDLYNVKFIVHPNGCPGFVVIQEEVSVPVAEDTPVDERLEGSGIVNVSVPTRFVPMNSDFDLSSDDEDILYD